MACSELFERYFAYLGAYERELKFMLDMEINSFSDHLKLLAIYL